MAFRIISAGRPVSYEKRRIGIVEHWVAIVDLVNTNTFKIIFTRPSSDIVGISTLSFYSVGRVSFEGHSPCVLITPWYMVVVAVPTKIGHNLRRLQ